ncbi:hypothetical protein PMZ80_010480 [Knufia obscura]|uniref:Short-chain dehydrogenase n=1 Tax=Knufia obscura TaxID=1635080 RepID=A0ABR0R971_9EURO|nr:hypothetical protein PMZ80_010480 [Knufia obscura]
MSAQPVLLFLGAGPKLGTQIPPIFAEAGYKIVLVARSLQDGFQDNGYYHVKADFSDPTSIPEVFDKVKQKVGIPTVVVYNAVQYKLDDPADPFASLAPESVSQFHTAVAVNGTTPLIAVQHAISAFRSLPPTTTGKALIFTGNILNHSQFKNRLCFGIAKTACAYGIRFASVAYAKERFRQAIYPYHLHFLDVHGKRQNGLQFYYADERTTSGMPVMRDIDGTAAGQEYLKLAETSEQLPWLYTYTQDSGYADFGEIDYLKTVYSDEPEHLKGGR